ncbi:hypothetical protein LTR10_002024 [Elasticomyces elasticus]|nr:hypothetical protein LTR10_002024 [Elasticomyces elasticus]KAK4973903.1 hypothetical protein LTR42_005893 [Elasticomyces elasticus]
MSSQPNKPESCIQLEHIKGDAWKDMDEDAMTDEQKKAARTVEKRLKLKLDFTILPLLSMIYFLAQMGRSDLANAAVAGMNKELGITARQYSTVASIFYVGYIVLQLPGTLLIRKIGPPAQFGLAMLAWGLTTTLAVEIHSYGGLLAMRIIVGGIEAFVQGAIFYLTFFYQPSELATRFAILYSTVALAGSCNGLIAYAITLTLDGHHGWRAWRWIFLVEGILPIACSFLVFFLLPKTPEGASPRIFTETEKAMMVRRSRAAQNTGESSVRYKLLLKLLADPLFWMLNVMGMALHYCTSSLSNFLPAILVGFGWTGVKAQVMSVVVYACAFVGILSFSYASDRLAKRGLIVSISSGVAAIGYAILLGSTNLSARFAATCLCAFGTYPGIAIVGAWTSTNNPGYTYRGGALALINMISQCISIASSHAYDDPPIYRKGNAVALGMMVITCVTAMALSVVYQRLNAIKKREQYSEAAEILRARYTVDDISHRHPDVFFHV